MILQEMRINAIKKIDKDNHFTNLDNKSPEELGIIYYCLIEGLALDKSRSKEYQDDATTNLHEISLDNERG